MTRSSSRTRRPERCFGTDKPGRAVDQQRPVRADRGRVRVAEGPRRDDGLPDADGRGARLAHAGVFRNTMAAMNTSTTATVINAAFAVLLMSAPSLNPSPAPPAERVRDDEQEQPDDLYERIVDHWSDSPLESAASWATAGRGRRPSSRPRSSSRSPARPLGQIFDRAGVTGSTLRRQPRSIIKVSSSTHSGHPGASE